MLIPALDEEEALPVQLARVPSSVDRVVVVDNGSTDGTVEVALAAGAEVVHEAERGYGAACLRGLRHLAERGARPDVVVFLDADGSDDPARIPALVRPVADGRAEMVLGVRRGGEGATGSILPHARVGNRVVLVLLALLFGRRFRDMPPFRAVSFPALEALAMDDRNWGWTLQMQIRAHRAGLGIVELDMPHRRRVRGRSKISGSLTTSLRVGLTMFRTLVRERFRPAPGGTRHEP